MKYIKLRSLSLILFVILNAPLYCQQNETVANEPPSIVSQEASCETKLSSCKSDQNSYRLSRYKDIYAIVGSPNTKINVSFKYQITSYLNLYLGYTQTMFWDLGKASSPFEDISFNPDVFYRLNFPQYTFLKAIDLGLYEHKSNGKGGLDSRSWSGSYVKLYTMVKFYSWSLDWDTKFYWFYNYKSFGGMDDTNQDIIEYSGFWDSRISFINYYDKDKLLNRISFYFDVFPGGRYSQQWNKGAQEFGIKFRMGRGMFYPSLFFQLYHGYNESLLSYNIEHTSYRVGIAF